MKINASLFFPQNILWNTFSNIIFVCSVSLFIKIIPHNQAILFHKNLSVSCNIVFFHEFCFSEIIFLSCIISSNELKCKANI